MAFEFAADVKNEAAATVDAEVRPSPNVGFFFCEM